MFISGTSCDATSTEPPTNQPTTPCLTYTTGGNGKGAFCQFPFRYKGRAYYECTRIDNKKPWCSTTSDYDTNEVWGVCSGNFKTATCLVLLVSIQLCQAFFAFKFVLLCVNMYWSPGDANMAVVVK